MVGTLDFTGWSGALLGLYLFFAGIGALRNAQAWHRMIEEIGASPALQLLAGLLELMVGALVYLANPWVPADILSCILKAVGGLMMVEALVVAGFCDIYAQFVLRLLDHTQRAWGWLSVLLGLALAVAGAMRFL